VNGDVIIPVELSEWMMTVFLQGFWKMRLCSGTKDPNGIRIPFYKMYQWTEDDILNPDKYHAELRERLRDLSAAYLNGPFNLFQLWPSRERVNDDIETGGGLYDYVTNDFYK